MRDIVFLNGRFVPHDEALVSVEDRGYQFADGVYEVVRFHGHHGLRLDAHLQRLQESAAALRIEGAPSVSEWNTILESQIAECELPDDPAHITCWYQQVSRGVSPRNHVFPKEKVTPSTVAYFRPAPIYTADQRENGVKLSSQPDERWNRCNVKSVSLLSVVMAKQAAADAGAFEALLVKNGIVTEGGATNAFCVRHGVLYTHPPGGAILSGVTRAIVLEAAKRAGIEVRKEAVTHEEFRKAEEAFLSSTTMDIMPATRLDDAPIGDGRVGPVTRRLVEGVNEIVETEIRGHALAAK